MMKMVKYDFKRSASVFLVGAIVFIIIQALIWWLIPHQNVNVGIPMSPEVRISTHEAKFSFSVVAYLFLVGALLIHIGKTYNTNLQSYSRRLAPVSSLSMIFSSVIFAWICMIAVALLALIHGLVYMIFTDLSVLQFFKDIKWLEVADLLFSMWWVFTFILFIVYLANTVTLSLRIKGRALIGTAVFFLVAVGGGYLEELILPQDWLELDTLIGNIGTFTYEAIFVALFVYLMVKLIDRRVEV